MSIPYWQNLSVHTEPHTQYRRNWVLRNCLDLGVYHTKAGKDHPYHYAKINLPKLEGEGRWFNRVIFYVRVFQRYTDKNYPFYWFFNTNRYVNWDESTTFDTHWQGLQTSDKTGMTSQSRYFSSPNAVDLGWHSWPIQLGIETIYRDNDFEACQVTLSGGLFVGPIADTKSGASLDNTVKCHWAPEGGTDYCGLEYAGWFNGFDHLRCFLFFDYRPSSMGPGDNFRMFWRGQWGGTSPGVN